MIRRSARPYGTSVTAMRAVSLVFLLGVVFLLFDRSRDPRMWNWLAPDRGVRAREHAVDVKVESPPGMLLTGPTDLDETESNSWTAESDLVTDGAALRPREMAAYWRLMGWGASQSFRELEERAKPDPSFTQFWEQPGKYRGVPIRLRLHMRRVLHYAAPENPLGLTDVYEAWGWTDDSKSFPYVVVFPDRPEGLPIGPDVEFDGEFVGYFLKMMAYTAYDVQRGAPLLVGRLHGLPRAGGMARNQPTGSGRNEWIWLAAIAGGAVMGIGWWMKRRAKPQAMAMPERVDFGDDEFEIERK